MSFIYSFIKNIFFIFFTIFYRLKIINHDCIPVAGGVIVAANHVSYLDPPVLGASLKRQPVYLARQGLFNIPVFRVLARAFALPVNRGKPQPSTIKEAVRRLRKGEMIVIFPEGGIRAEGSAQDVKRGVGMIAAMSRVPVVPAYIDGTDKALPDGARLFRPARIRVVFGNPIVPEQAETSKHYQEKIAEEIMDRIRQLKRQLS